MEKDKTMLMIFVCTICGCLLTYFVGMFALGQETNPVNLPLRQKLVDLLSFISAQTLAIVYITVTGKVKDKDEEK